MNCLGLDGKESINKAPVNIQKLFPNYKCCTGFTIEWNQKPIDDIFCSYTKDVKSCTVENKLFRSTLYKYCTLATVKQLFSFSKAIYDKDALSNLLINFRSFFSKY